jgi:hypothetical protein
LDELNALRQRDFSFDDFAGYRKRFASLRELPPGERRHAQLELRRVESQWVTEFIGRWLVRWLAVDDRPHLVLE